MHVVEHLTGTLGSVLFNEWKKPVLYGSSPEVRDPQYGFLIKSIRSIPKQSDFNSFKEEFETRLDSILKSEKYEKDTGKPSTSPTKIFPDHNSRLDFVRIIPDNARIGIEVEKAERRFGTRDVMKILLAFSWDNPILDIGFLILPESSHATGNHAVASLKEINRFLVPILSQFHLWVIKNKFGVIVVDWTKN